MQLRREFYDFLLKWRENKRGNVGVVGKKITLPHYMAMFVEPAG